MISSLFTYRGDYEIRCSLFASLSFASNDICYRYRVCRCFPVLA